MDKIDEILRQFIKELEFTPALGMFEKIGSGKKLRSKLILKIAGESEKSLKLCAVIELIHLASLLHDDVIDESVTRRGNASINAIYGAKNAIMLGDILYSKSFNEIAKLDAHIADIVSNAVCKLSLGELMDVKMSESFNSDKEKYLKMIYFKTAVLIEAAAKSAALIANLDIKPYEIYGKNLGLAFQIIDDILDITADEQTLGKPAMNDFSEGKTTLPYILLYETMNDESKEKLIKLFGIHPNSEQKAWLISEFTRSCAITKSIEIAKDYGRKALEATSNKSLVQIAISMIDREF